MRRITAILIIIIMLSTLLSTYAIKGEDEYYVDGAILSELFIQVLNDIKSGNLSLVEYEINSISSTYLPPDIGYIHNKTYSRLLDVAMKINILNKELMYALTNSSPEMIDVIRSNAIELYSDRLELGDTLNNYVTSLKKYIPRGEGLYYDKRLKLSIESFLNYLDDLVYRAGEVIKELETIHGIGLLHIDIGSIEETADPGSLYNIPLRFRYSNNIFRNSSLVIELYIGLGYSKRYVFNVPYIENKTFRIRLPDTIELTRHHIITKVNLIPVYGVVYLKAFYNNSDIIAGRSSFRFNMEVYKPRVRIHVPSLVYYREIINISISSDLDTLLNTSVYIDGAFYGNFTIAPGQSYITISSYNVSKGYHTIIFYIHPTGRYRSIRYSASLAITGKPVKASITFPRECIEPFTGYRVYGVLRSNQSYNDLRLVVYVDDKPVLNQSIGRSFDVDVPLPLTPFISIYRLKILYGPRDPYYDPYILETNVITINVLGIILFSFIGLAGVFIGLSYEREIILRSLTTGLRRLYKAAKSGYGVGGRFKELILVKVSRSRIAEIYWSLISRFPNIFPKPFDNETLREYLSRVLTTLTSILKEDFKKLTILVEKDLYSRERVDKSLVEGIVRRIRDEVE